MRGIASRSRLGLGKQGCSESQALLEDERADEYDAVQLGGLVREGGVPGTRDREDAVQLPGSSCEREGLPADGLGRD